MAQFKDEGLPDDEASRLLRAEYEVLCQCDGFKSKFDAFACESLVAVPGVSLLDAILLEKNFMSICPQWSKARKFVHPKLYCCVVYCCAILSAYTAFFPSWHLDLY